MWLVYVCIAYAMFSDDIVEQFAMGHAYIARTKKIQGNVNAETQREKAIGKNKTKQRNKEQPQNAQADKTSKSKLRPWKYESRLAVLKRVLTHTDKPTSEKPMKVERAILILKQKEHMSKFKGHFIMFILFCDARYLTTHQLANSKQCLHMHTRSKTANVGKHVTGKSKGAKWRPNNYAESPRTNKENEHSSKSKGHFVMCVSICQARSLTTVQLTNSK